MAPLSLTVLAVVGVLLVVGALALARSRRESPYGSAPVVNGAVQAPTGPQEWIFAQVWPKEDATPEELQALGEALQAWWAEHPHVTGIRGLDDLLSGSYPPPDGPTTVRESPDGRWMPVPRPGPEGMRIEYRRMAIVDPWKYCPAMVWGGEGMNGEDAIESLKRSIPPELVSGIVLSFY